MLLEEIAMFGRVAAAGTLAEAARQHGVPKSTLSRAIARLEDATGVQLVNRGPRSIALTDAGRAFADQVGPHLGAVREATRGLAIEPGVTGTLRISLLPTGSALFADAFVRFGARYPGVRMDIEVSYRPVDLVRDGVHVALRGSGTPQAGDTLVACKLVSADFGLYAAPSYVARHGAPQEPAELAGHDLVTYAPVFTDADVRPEALRRALAGARASANELDLVRCMLRAGGGIGPLTSFAAAADLAQGSLVRILPGWSHRVGALYLVYPAARRVPQHVAAFRDFLLGEVPPDESVGSQIGERAGDAFVPGAGALPGGVGGACPPDVGERRPRRAALP